MKGLFAWIGILFLVFLFGRLWFSLIESLLQKIKRCFFRRPPAPWHPLPPSWQSPPQDPGHGEEEDPSFRA